MKYLVISNGIKPLLLAKTVYAYPIAEVIALSGQSAGGNIICDKNHSVAQNFNEDGLRFLVLSHNYLDASLDLKQRRCWSVTLDSGPLPSTMTQPESSV